MSRTFAYVRVSTIQQTIENQVQELERWSQEFGPVAKLWRLTKD